MALDPRRQAIDHNERRIGERHSISVAIEWYPTLRPPRRRRKAHSARTENLSFSGAGFVDETDPHVHEFTMLTVTIKGVTGQAKVRVIRDAVESGHAYYGIEFSDRRLLDSIRDLIADHAPAMSRPSARPIAVEPPPSANRGWPG